MIQGLKMVSINHGISYIQFIFKV